MDKKTTDRIVEEVEKATSKVRELVFRELEILEAMPILGEDGLDRLAKIALILQRTKPQFSVGGGFSDRELMRKAADADE